MTLKDFCELLDVYGSDLRKWPNDRRAAALTLLERSDAAKKAFADACGFDAALLWDGDELSDTHRQSLVDQIMHAVGPAGDEEEAAKARSDQPKQGPAPAMPSDKLIELLAGFIALSPEDSNDQSTQENRTAQFFRSVVDATLRGKGRSDALAALAHRQKAYDDALKATGGYAGGQMATVFVEGGLTEDLVDRWAATQKAIFDAQLRFIGGVFVDLSGILDRADRERLIAEAGRILRGQ